MTTNRCAHHWIIATAHGPICKGRCRLCGEEGEFANSLEYQGGAGHLRSSAPQRHPYQEGAKGQ